MAGKPVLISDWLKKWREIFKPITERENVKPKRTRKSLSVTNGDHHKWQEFCR